MKTVLLFIFFGALNSWAGHDRGGGGDLCDNRIQIIREDLKNWIYNGGHKDLLLPDGHTAKSYSTDMLKELDVAKISCVAEGDRDFPVEFNGKPKTCRFRKSQNESLIICDIKKFNLLSESDQYVQIHHEYAGLADIEVPRDDESDYSVSNQISGYLQNQVVKKLVVKSFNRSGNEEWQMLYGHEAKHVTWEILKALEVAQFSDCRIDVVKLPNSNIPVVVRLEKHNPNYIELGSNVLDFTFAPHEYPPSKGYAGIGYGHQTLLKNTAGQPLLKNEFYNFKFQGERSHLQVIYTTDPDYKKITKISFYEVSFKSVNVGNILEHVYETQATERFNFACHTIEGIP